MYYKNTYGVTPNYPLNVPMDCGDFSSCFHRIQFFRTAELLKVNLEDTWLLIQMATSAEEAT